MRTPVVATILVVVAMAATWAGCAVFQVPEEPPTPSPIRPVWSDDELEDHLNFLNSGNAARRTTGTQGYARAAAYVAARMGEFRLQPVLHEEFRIVYSTPINYPLSAALRTVAISDSALFYPGIDVLADGRSDSGAVSVQTVVITDDTTGLRSPPREPFAVVFRDGGVDTETLSRWRVAGAVLSISIDSLSPRFYSRRVAGLVALQLAPHALLRLLPADVAAARSGRSFRLRHRIVGHVNATYQANAGAMNVIGYVAGKHPRHARDLVLVCGDLDAVSDFAGVQTVDFRNFGIETSALLEVARNLSYVSRRWSLPERSVMLAVWSGSELGHVGLRQFLDDPTWSLGRISSVIYVGLSAEEEPVVRRILADKGLSLDVIRAPTAPLYERPLVLIPDPTVRRLVRESRRSDGLAVAEHLEAPALPNMDVVIDSAVVQARKLAENVYERMMLATTHPRPFYPVLEDTLRTPPNAGDESL